MYNNLTFYTIKLQKFFKTESYFRKVFVDDVLGKDWDS